MTTRADRNGKEAQEWMRDLLDWVAPYGLTDLAPRAKAWSEQPGVVNPFTGDPVWAATQAEVERSRA